MPTLEQWGRLQVIVGGEDVTFYRDIPCKPLRWTFNEPFSDATAEIFFPQITGFEEPPAFLQASGEAPNVDLWLVRPDNTQKVLWEGMVASFEVDESGITIVCIGALYQLDLYRKAPSFNTQLRDVQEVIAEEFTTAHPSLRTGPPAYVLGSGLNTRQRGGWTRALTGYVQDLLTQAEFAEGVNPDGTQLTLIKEPGRTPSLGLKDNVSEHWVASFGAPGIECRLTRDRLAEPNVYYGEGIDNDDHCHWRNTKYPDNDLYTGYFAPLVSATEVEPYLYDAYGTISAVNSLYDSSVPRIEQFTNYGEGIDLAQGVQTAERAFLRENTPGWYGTITFRADPEVGADGVWESRFEMRINENIRLDNFQGDSILLHFCQVAVDLDAGTVTCTVDSKARNMLTLAQIMRRDASDAVDPMKRYRQYRNSRNVEDRIHVFDCEAGGGVVDSVSLAAAQWTVVQVPFGEYGQLVRTDFQCTSAVRFSMAVFDQPISASVITSAMPLGPLTNTAAGLNPWNAFPEGYGLIVAWGGPGQAAGYYPGAETDTTPVVTGRLVDDAIWSYATPTPPWLWVAFWAVSATTISGRFYPGVEGYS